MAIPKVPFLERKKKKLKLWGPVAALREMADFAFKTRLTI